MLTSQPQLMLNLVDFDDAVDARGDEMATAHVTLFGRFAVVVGERVVPDARWGRRDPAALVKLLALSPNRELHREQVIDAIWPDDSIEQAVPKLHKAAHFARKAIGSADAVRLRGEMVALFPGAKVVVDVEEFERLARAALSRHDVQAADRALARYRGDLVPQDRYEPWAEGRRERLRLLRLDLLRLAGRWNEVLEHDEADETAHVALMRRYADAGDRHGALRQYERLTRSLQRELGIAPSDLARELHRGLLAEQKRRDAVA